MNSDAKDGITWLIESGRGRKPDDFVAFLLSQMRGASHKPSEIEYVTGALRAAARAYSKESSSQRENLVCDFCGTPEKDVDTLMVSANGSICDLCAVGALRAISKQRGQAHLRVAFAAFEAIASVTYFFSGGARPRKAP